MDPFLTLVFSPIGEINESEIRRLGLAYNILLLDSVDVDGEFDTDLRHNLVKVMQHRYALNAEEKAVLEAHFFSEPRNTLDIWGLSQSARAGMERLVKWKVLDEIWKVVKQAKIPENQEDYVLQKMSLLMGVSVSESAESRVRVETGLDAS